MMDFHFDVDESGQRYGASLNRADVYVGDDTWCSALGPRVDNVTIN